MTPAEIAALLMAGVALAGLYFRHREARASSVATEVESVSRLLADLKAAHDQIDLYRDQLESSRDQEDDCQEALQKVRREHTSTLAELGVCVTRIAKLEAATPLLKISDRIENLSASMERVLDRCRDGIVLSAPAEAGRFVYVNKTFADALGRTPAEIIAAGWKSFVHPDDAEPAERAEIDAWNSGGELVNRYRHADGHYVTMRWHFTVYDNGYAFSVVWIDRRKNGGARPVFVGEA